MADTGHKHNHPPQPTQAPPPSQALPLGAARGPVYPPTEQLQHLQFCIHSNPSWLESSMLAFQHYIVMLGTTVLIASTLVPLMGGSHGDKSRVIQTILFMSGLNTLLQTMIGSRLPTVMGASYAFVIPVLAIINDLRDEDFTSEHERFVHTMRTIQGSLIVCSFLNIILGFSKAWGNLTRLFSPLVLVPVVCVVGLGLFMRGFPLLANCVEIGLPMLILLVVIQQYLVRYLKHALPRGHYIVERFGLLFCIGIVWAFAAILTAAGAYNNVREQTKMSCRTDRSYLIQSAPWIKIPYPFQWGTPIFRASHVFGMIGAALVTSAESTGAFFAAARISGATPPPAHVLSRSIGLQGIFLLLEGIFGAAVGTTASVENVGLLGLTHIGSRRVVQISTAFMIFFSIFGKFGAFFASIPLPIFAAAYCVLLGIVAAVGISFIQFTNYNSLRNQYVLGLSLFLGISIPQYFVLKTNQTNGHGPVRTDSGWGGKGFRWGVKKFVKRIDIAGIEPIGLSLVAIYLLFYIMLKSKKIYLFLFVQFDNIINTIFSSPPTVAIIVGVLLDNTLEWKQTIQERGLPWLVPFQNRHGEARNAEFYGLPLRINEYMPSRFF